MNPIYLPYLPYLPYLSILYYSYLVIYTHTLHPEPYNEYPHIFPNSLHFKAACLPCGRMNFPFPFHFISFTMSLSIYLIIYLSIHTSILNPLNAPSIPFIPFHFKPVLPPDPHPHSMMEKRKSETTHQPLPSKAKTLQYSAIM